MPPAPIIDPAEIDTDKVLYDIEAIRKGNPQRFEMEQISAVVQLDRDAGVIVGYKDVRRDEFWVPGHMPGAPVMPGVLMCEAAAQLCGFYCHVTGAITEGFLGFGGMEDVRFRGAVRPGDRVVLVGKAARVRRSRIVFETQAFVAGKMVFNGTMFGVALSTASGATPPGNE